MSSLPLPALLIGLATGAAIACLGPINTLLQGRAGPWSTLVIVHLLGLAVALLGWLLSGRTPLPTDSAALRAALLVLLVAVVAALVVLGRGALMLGVPALGLVGGLVGLLVVLGTLSAIQGLGVLGGITTILLAELTSAAVIDAFGLLGRPAVHLSGVRLLGLAVVAAGVLMVVRRNA
ncbi:DMT family transporter [Deinococcus maricopensis]|uniref:Transporter family-2 protein n=1 Tax=Deinococcus maricopensis (strain DSM 21211 / LMG 22137 / NRRL B-23946 / LB-34) TaxID=709986 RepID=E8U7T8_DEIML|nr:DMT family transporter [Deinococcus maricopensis]ADV67127.1 protein of unknown function DUF606 [Deinococcus maricopensis DSM 21211]